MMIGLTSRGLLRLAICLSVTFVLLLQPVPHSSADQTTYYVAPNGSDGNPGTETSPFRTLTKGVSVLQPGATLLVFPGTYAESLDANIPSGTDWTAPVTLRAYDPANRPVIRPPVSSSTEYRVLFFTKNKFTGLPQHHIVVDGFVLDGSNTNPDAVKITDGAHHIRLMNSEVKNAPRQGILTTNVNSAYNEFINLDVHNNGTDTLLDHGLYISTPYNLVAHCHVYNNAAYGIHVYNGDNVSAHDNIVRDNIVHDQAVKSGIVIASGSGNLVYNNVVWGNKSSGIRVNYGANGARIYNNTIYGNAGYGIDIGSSGSNTAIRNNIIYKNGSTAINNGGSGTTTGTNLINVDPKFVNEAAKDFHLQQGSSAINAGTTLTEVPTDRDGVQRPQGAAYDIGSYESTGTGTGPTPTPTTITISPTPTPIVSPTPTPIVSPTPTPVSTAFSWEAEDGVVSGFTKATNANNVTYIYQPTSVSTPSQGGKAVYNFTLASPGTYVVRIVVNAPNLDANSLYVNVDSEPSDPTMISDITQLTGTTTFEARTLSWRGNGTFDNNQYVPEVFSLSAGTHQLIVRGREAKVLLDRISVEPY